MVSSDELNAAQQQINAARDQTHTNIAAAKSWADLAKASADLSGAGSAISAAADANRAEVAKDATLTARDEASGFAGSASLDADRAASERGLAEAARDRAEAVPDVQDGLLASIVSDEGSESRAALNATYAEVSGPLAFAAAAHGVTASATIDQKPALQALIDTAPAGATIRLAPGEYRLNSTLTLPKPVHLIGDGAILHAHHANSLLTITGDDVDVSNLSGIGQGGATYVSSARGVTATGSDRLTLTNVAMSNFASAGIFISDAEDIRLTNVAVSDCNYSGIGLSGVRGATLTRPIVKNIDLAGQPNAYGITATKVAGGPRSSDVTITDAVVDGVPGWAGIDTHAGERFTIRRARISNCERGIDIAAGAGDTSSTTLAALDFLIEACVVTDCSLHGIGVSGAGTFGALAERATGTIIGCVTIDCASPASATSGAYWLRITDRLQMVSCTAVRPGSNAVALSYDNRSVRIAGITVEDVHSTTATTAAVVSSRSANVTGEVTGLVALRGALVAPAGGSVNAFGYYGAVNDPGTSIALGTISGTTTAAFESSGGTATVSNNVAAQVSTGRSGGKLGFYGATPVARPTATADAASLRAALVALGLIAA